jgi:hypothetical protein
MAMIPDDGHRHPNYWNAHPDSRRLHDAVKNFVRTTLQAETKVTVANLVFRKRINFATINAILVMRPELTISLYGLPTDFTDPRTFLIPGRRKNDWSRFFLTSERDLPYAYNLLEQACRLSG